jgi:hypothetical protein
MSLTSSLDSNSLANHECGVIGSECRRAALRGRTVPPCTRHLTPCIRECKRPKSTMM